MTRNIPLGPALLAAALLTASPALAAEGGHDDALHADVPAAFAIDARAGAIETPDVTYPGPQAVVASPALRPWDDALASHDDVLYPSADAPARVAAGTPRPAEPSCADERVAYACDHR